MNIKKYLSVLCLCLTLAVVIAPKLVRSIEPTACTFNPEIYQGLNLTKLSGQLTEGGLIGRIHGAINESKMYVLSVRSPDNFFEHREFSLIPQNQGDVKTLATAKRHDLVCVQGKFLTNPSPQKHIALNNIRILESWSQPEGLTTQPSKGVLPPELLEQSTLTGKVHAIGDGGKILVMGYQGAVIPVFVQATEYTRGLYRGDIVKLAYQVQSHPQQPTHLKLDLEAAKPLEVVDAIAAWHDQSTTLSGSLVKFPQSPQLKFDVYGIEVKTQGFKRYFTLINFEDLAEFERIRQKLAQIWSENEATAVVDRNKLINPQVIIEAQGITNIVSPEQANPQILLQHAAQLRQLA